MLDLYEPDVHYMPKLSDIINYDIPAEVSEGIPLLFANVNVPEGIDKEDFWRYIQLQYGEHRLLPNYALFSESMSLAHGLPKRFLPKIPHINQALIAVFDSNYAKYYRLLRSLEKEYDPLEPFNVLEENSFAEDTAKLSTTVGSHTDDTYETSMDSTTLQKTGETVVGSHDDSSEYEHDMSVQFENNSFESNRSHVNHSMNRRKGNLGNMSYADLVEKEAKLGKFSLYDIMSNDIIDMICYKIFASC